MKAMAFAAISLYDIQRSTSRPFLNLAKQTMSGPKSPFNRLFESSRMSVVAIIMQRSHGGKNESHGFCCDIALLYSTEHIAAIFEFDDANHIRSEKPF